MVLHLPALQLPPASPLLGPRGTKAASLYKGGKQQEEQEQETGALSWLVTIGTTARRLVGKGHGGIRGLASISDPPGKIQEPGHTPSLIKYGKGSVFENETPD